MQYPEANEVEKFKETELGSIPGSWRVKALDNEYIEFKNGLWTGKKGPYVKIRVLRNTNFNNDGSLRLVKVAELNVELKQFQTRKLSRGDIILERSGGGPTQPVGRVVFFEIKDGLDYSFSNFTSRIRIIDKEQIYSRYLFYFLLSFHLSGGTIDIQNRTTGIRNLDFLKYKNILIPIPPFREQEKIAFVLSTIQEVKEKTDRVINALKELKKSLMKHLFTYGSASLEEVEKVKLKETEIGMMPEEWEIKKLGDHCSYKTGKLNSEAGSTFGKYPFFTCSQETFRIDSYSFDQEALLLAGNNARGIYSVKYYNGKFDVYQRTYVLTIKNKNEVEYIFLLYELERKLENLRNQSLGSTTQYLTAGIINGLELAIPKVEEQRQIASILSSIDEKIEKEENRKRALKELFKSMLHNLMTAKVRVNDLKLEVKNG